MSGGFEERLVETALFHLLSSSRAASCRGPGPHSSGPLLLHGLAEGVERGWVASVSFEGASSDGAGGMVEWRPTARGERALRAYVERVKLAPLEPTPGSKAARTGKRVYISGPITGVADLNRPAFEEVARELRAAGYDAVNPHESGVPVEASWELHMRADLAALVTCTALVYLPGADESRGSQVERYVAAALGIPEYTPDDLLAKP